MSENTNGGRTDCHFYKDNGKRPSCQALRKFYNEDDPSDICGKCPFFKTDEEYINGRERRYADGKIRIKRIV